MRLKTPALQAARWFMTEWVNRVGRKGPLKLLFQAAFSCVRHNHKIQRRGILCQIKKSGTLAAQIFGSGLLDIWEAYFIMM